MKVLFTGRGTSGSWQIRGCQVARQIGAEAIPMATLDDCRRADVIVVVKRLPPPLLANIRASGRPWVWDTVDSYPQPESESWEKPRAMEWLRGEVARLRPTEIIWPNAQMRGDHGGGAVIYHHHRVGMLVNPIRQGVRKIGFEGALSCIRGWERAIEAACKKVGAVFVVNPERLCDMDAVLALRSHAGYPQTFWKSNVKLANAHGSGTPFIGQPEAAYKEIATGAELWINGPDDIPAAVEQIARPETRRAIRAQFLKVAMPVEDIGQAYTKFLCALKS